MTDPHEFVQQLIAEHFDSVDPDQVSDDTAITSLGDEDAVDEFYDGLDDAVEESVFLSDRDEKLATVGQIVSWLTETAKAAAEKADEERKDALARNWQEEILPVQRLLMNASWGIGMVLIALAVFVFKVNGQLNQPLFGLGMFIAVQFKWGVAGLYEWLAKNRTAMVERMGHAKLFWFVIIGAYLLSLIEIGLFFALVGLGN